MAANAEVKPAETEATADDAKSADANADATPADGKTDTKPTDAKTEAKPETDAKAADAKTDAKADGANTDAKADGAKTDAKEADANTETDPKAADAKTDSAKTEAKADDAGLGDANTELAKANAVALASTGDARLGEANTALAKPDSGALANTDEKPYPRASSKSDGPEWTNRTLPSATTPATGVAAITPMPPGPDRDPRRPSSPALQAGSKLSRYEIKKRLGEGGMAVVYSARDPQLGRNVAIKLLHTELSKNVDRLVREAQAMAQLSHPNVVTVYEVGVDNGQIFMCLELVVGSDLRGWLEEKPRSLDEILATFIAAGRGLEAAHAQRLVHRDFKPDNVLIDASGRARVTDFGIARDMSEPGGKEALEHARTLSGMKMAIPLTATGALMGTPNYMAPELFEGGVADVRSDQYAYCVALSEAVYGALPFSATSLPQLIAKVTTGKRDPLPEGRKVPRWLRAVIDRGMSLKPSDRFESMTQLLALLELDRGARYRRFAGAALGVTALSFGAALWVKSDDSGPKCETSGRLDGVWDASRRANIEKAFLQTGVPHAEMSLKAALAQLESYAAGWSAMDREVCEASVVRKEQSPELAELRSLCLEMRRSDFALAVGALEKPDAQTIARADDVIGSLPSVTQCANANELRQVVPPPSDPASKTTISEVERSLAEASLELELGHYDKASTLIATSEPAGKKLEYQPLLARLLDLRGLVEQKRGQFESAERTFLEAASAAERGRDDRRKVQVLGHLGFLVAWDREDARHGKPFITLAESGLDRLGGDRELRLELTSMAASVAYVDGDFELALRRSKEELTLQEQIRGKSDPRVATALNHVATANLALGRTDEANALHRRALQILATTYGEQHPDYAVVLNDLANGLVQMGKLDEAEEAYRRSYAIMQSAFGKRHPETATAGSNVALVLYMRGDMDAASALFEETLHIEEEVLGDEHLGVAITLINLSAAQMGRGQPVAAETSLRRALAIRKKHLPADDPRIAEAQGALGTALVALKRYQDARTLLEPVVQILCDDQTVRCAEAQFSLAQSLWELGLDRARAKELAASAQTKVAASDATTAREIAAWRAKH